jgi:hypothetical protein
MNSYPHITAWSDHEVSVWEIGPSEAERFPSVCVFLWHSLGTVDVTVQQAEGEPTKRLEVEPPGALAAAYAEWMKVSPRHRFGGGPVWTGRWA